MIKKRSTFENVHVRIFEKLFRDKEKGIIMIIDENSNFSCLYLRLFVWISPLNPFDLSTNMFFRGDLVQQGNELCDLGNLESEEFCGSRFSCDLLYLSRDSRRGADLWTGEWERKALDRDCSSRNDRNRRSRIWCHLDCVAYCSWCTRQNNRCPGRSLPYCNTWENNLYDEYCREPGVYITEKW